MPELFPRRCEKCHTGIREGFVFDDCSTYCEGCAFDTPAERAEYESSYDPEGSDYWTEWDELHPDYAFLTDGTEVNP